MEIFHTFHFDQMSFPDLLEIIIGFFLGTASRIRFLKARDLTIMLQVALLSVRVLKWLVKQYHPIKMHSYKGVDEDLTRMHEKILRENNLADKTPLS